MKYLMGYVSYVYDSVGAWKEHINSKIIIVSKKKLSNLNILKKSSYHIIVLVSSPPPLNCLVFTLVTLIRRYIRFNVIDT